MTHESEHSAHGYARSYKSTQALASCPQVWRVSRVRLRQQQATLRPTTISTCTRCGKAGRFSTGTILRRARNRQSLLGTWRSGRSNHWHHIESCTVSPECVKGKSRHFLSRHEASLGYPPVFGTNVIHSGSILDREVGIRDAKSGRWRIPRAQASVLMRTGPCTAKPFIVSAPNRSRHVTCECSARVPLSCEFL